MRRILNFRIFGTLCLIAVLGFSTVGFTSMTVGVPGLPETYYTLTGSPYAACGRNKTDPPETPEQQRARWLSYASQAEGALTDLQPLVATLNPRVGEIVRQAQPIAHQVTEAIRTGDVSSAAAAARTLIPLINQIGPLLTSNVTALTVFAIASLGARYLVANLPQLQGAATRGAISDPTADEIERLKTSDVWECKYQEKLCKEMGIKPR